MANSTGGCFVADWAPPTLILAALTLFVSAISLYGALLHFGGPLVMLTSKVVFLLWLRGAFESTSLLPTHP